MAKNKFIDSIKLQKELFKRTEKYAKNVRNIYDDALGQLIELVKNTELKDGVPFSFEAYGYEGDVAVILKKMYSQVYREIRGDSEKEWMLSNAHNDQLVQGIFGKNAINDSHFTRYFQRNKEAMDAFLKRRSGAEGLNLSDKVWRYTTDQFKTEIEDTLELALGEGTGANSLAAKVKKYLKEPDRVYRRFRVKTGEDEYGNPVYGSIWKRRVRDEETGSHKWIDEDPKKYKPGRGVYRSSARNAQRLARTETNIAYRSADYERWQQLDFIVGVEIKLSNNHPVYDICDDLAGIYPKDFKWTGWHPNCRCYMIPVFAKNGDIKALIEDIMSEGGDGSITEVPITEYPENFQTWLKSNQERMLKAEAKGTVPYFIKDNKAGIEDILNPLTPEQKYHKSLVSKYGEESVQKLYSAFDDFKGKISTGDFEHQIKKLTFEVDWIQKNGKYPTSPEMVKMLEKELAVVKNKHEIQLAVTAAQDVLGYKSKSNPLNAILGDLKVKISSEGTAKEIQELAEKARLKIQEVEKARLAKLVKGNADGSTIDLYATPAEKLEIARLQGEYDKMMTKHGSQWHSDVNRGYQRLADYKKELSLKYVSKQGKLVKLNGETEELAKKALDEYVNAPMSSAASTPVGGRWQTRSSEKSKITDYSKKTGISEDELGLINRYTYGSKWCNNYGYGVVDSYFGKVQDYNGLCQKYFPAHNAALEKMPRYNGTVFSGISFDAMQLDKYVAEMKACLSSGKPYANPAFISSTTNIDRTTIFGDNLMLVIKSKKGVDVKAISHYASEDEIVFRAGSKFKVTAVYQETKRKYGFGRGWVVELEEV